MEQKRLKKYLRITFLISWISWGILAILIKNGILEYSKIISQILLTIGQFGPTIAALMVYKEKITFKSIKKYIFYSKKNSFKYLLLICIIQIAAIGLSSKINSDIALYTLPLMIIQAILIAGGNEELGWRGVMQPILEKRTKFPIATIMTGIIWASWHLPLWLVDGSVQQKTPFLIFMVYVIFLSFWLAGLYKVTHCIFYCAILHGISNVLLNIFVLDANWILIVGFILELAVSIILWYREEKISNEKSSNNRKSEVGE